ncbi:MAG: nitrogenase-associated protein [Holophagaceae bacterium]|nr:nitrogenase-associated protein [Holophagaceae bacterium]
MASVVFYEKPGCINNSRQKEILRAAGHELVCRNLLEEGWTRETLTPFFASRDPAMLLNRAAPAVKRGEIDPTGLGYEEALAFMLQDPILIRRPLIAVDGLFLQGFEDPRLKPYLGAWGGGEDLATCPNLAATPCEGAWVQPGLRMEQGTPVMQRPQPAYFPM